MDGAWYFARRGVRAAFGFQGAGIAVVLAGSVAYLAILVDKRTLIFVGDLSRA